MLKISARKGACFQISSDLIIAGNKYQIGLHWRVHFLGQHSELYGTVQRDCLTYTYIFIVRLVSDKTSGLCL